MAPVLCAWLSKFDRMAYSSPLTQMTSPLHTCTAFCFIRLCTNGHHVDFIFGCCECYHNNQGDVGISLVLSDFIFFGSIATSEITGGIWCAIFSSFLAFKGFSILFFRVNSLFGKGSVKGSLFPALHAVPTPDLPHKIPPQYMFQVSLERSQRGVSLYVIRAEGPR